MPDPHDGAETTVRIVNLAAGGAGVARLPDGMTVFVPRTASGDEVRLAAVRRKRRFATAQVAQLVAAGPGRVAPPCPHFVHDRCGGCQWQHLAIERQREAKARIVGDALRRIGRLDVPDPPLVASPRQYHYRATITLTVRHTASRTIAGFHDSVDPARVFHLDKCHIAREEVDRLWQAVRTSLAVLPRGDDVRLKLRVAQDGSLHVMVEGGQEAWGGARELADALQRSGLRATIWWKPARGAPRRMAGVEANEGAVAFAQVNPEVAALLREQVTSQAVWRSGGEKRRILDLYGGVGHTALPLAALGHEVVLVEHDGRAVRQAEEAAASRGLQLRCVASRVENALASLLPADVVIVNPPRTGLADVVADRLTALPPDRLLYVSCDPATLARDLLRLGVSASALQLQSFDMFPQTSHVETLAIVDRGAA